VYCSVLQCVAVCCSVLQCVAVCCSVLQCVAVCCSVSHRHWIGQSTLMNLKDTKNEKKSKQGLITVDKSLKSHK